MQLESWGLVMKLNKRKLLLVLASVFLVLAGSFLVIRQGIWHANARKYIKSQVPTLFIHGYGSSYKAEKKLVNFALNSGASSGVIRANVDRQGKVTLQGKFTATVNNPLVEVNFTDNKNPNYQTDGSYLKAVVKKLQESYHIKTFNVVAHSMGNMALAYYMLANAQDESLPKLNKEVNLAGHYNGIIGYNEPSQRNLLADGKPVEMTRNYQELLALRKLYPRQVEVLNIYGNLQDKTNSDGRVAVESAKSLRYLLAKRIKSYREIEIKGRGGQHSQLHENRRVAKEIVNFLFLKG